MFHFLTHLEKRLENLMTDIADDVKAILAKLETPVTPPAVTVDLTPVVDAINASTASVLAAVADVKAQLTPTAPPAA